jgi:hypothetical protein
MVYNNNSNKDKDLHSFIFVITYDIILNQSIEPNQFVFLHKILHVFYTQNTQQGFYVVYFNEQIRDRPHSWVITGTSIKSGGFKLATHKRKIQITYKSIYSKYRNVPQKKDLFFRICTY